MVVEISEFPLTIYYKPALYLLLKSSPNSILEYFLRQYRPTASCSSHHGHLTCSRHVCVGIWIEVRISDRVWMEGVHHMSGELFLLIEPNAAFSFHWNSVALLTHIWLMAHSIPLWCFFPELLHNQLFPGLYLCCWLFQPNWCLHSKKWPTLIKIPQHTLLQFVRLAMQVYFSLILHSIPWLHIYCTDRWYLYLDTQFFGKVGYVLPLIEGKFANCKSSQLRPWKHHLNIWVCSFSSSPLIRIWVFCRPSPSSPKK